MDGIDTIGASASPSDASESSNDESSDDYQPEVRPKKASAGVVRARDKESKKQKYSRFIGLKPWTRFKKPPKPLPTRLQRKSLHVLNVVQSYGRKSVWTPHAGIREIIQNAFDGIVQFCGIRLTDLVVTEYRDGLPAVSADSTLGSPDLGSQTITFFITRECPSKTPKGSKTEILGYISWKPSGKVVGYRRIGDLGVFNVAEPLDKSKLRFGSTTKADDPNTIGHHGDGLKVGINAILRSNKSIRVGYHTGEKLWTFGYSFGQEIEDADGVFCADDELIAYQTAPNTKSPVQGVAAHIWGIPCSCLGFENFLLLRPCNDMLASPCGSKILLHESHRSKIFVKGIFIRKQSSGARQLHYGLDVHVSIQLSRDRTGLEDLEELEKVSTVLWQGAMQASDATAERARSLYLDLILQHEKSLDVLGIEQHLSKDCARLLFEQLRKEKGADKFFYFAKDTEKPVRIIEKFLRKQPFLIPEILAAALLRHEVFLTPEQARTKQFLRLGTSNKLRQKAPSISYTRYMLQALKTLMSRENFSLPRLRFKAGTSEDILCTTATDGDIFLNDCTLDPDYVHLQPGSSSCHRFMFYETSKDCLCDCCAAYAMNLYTQEIDNRPDLDPTALMTERNHLLSAMPRDMSVEFSPSASPVTSEHAPVKISWKSQADGGYVVYVYRGDIRKTGLFIHGEAQGGSSADSAPADGTAPPVSSTPPGSPNHTLDEPDRTLDEPEKDLSTTATGQDDNDPGCSLELQQEASTACDEELETGDFVEPHTSRENNPDKLIRTRSQDLDLLLDFGETYTVRIRLDAKKSMYSFPFYFTVPPPQPTGLQVRWISSSELDVTWDEVRGALEYHVSFFTQDDTGILHFSDSQTVSGLSWRGIGQRTDRIFYKVELLGVAKEGTLSLNPAVELVPRAPKPSQPSKLPSASTGVGSKEGTAASEDNNKQKSRKSQEQAEVAEKLNNSDAKSNANSDPDSCDEEEEYSDPDEGDSDYSSGTEPEDEEDSDYEDIRIRKPKRVSRTSKVPERLTQTTVCDQVIKVETYCKASIMLQKRRPSNQPRKHKHRSQEEVLLYVHDIEVSRDGNVALWVTRYISLDNYCRQQAGELPDEQSSDAESLSVPVHARIPDNGLTELLLVYSDPDNMGLLDDAEKLIVDRITSVLNTSLVVPHIPFSRTEVGLAPHSYFVRWALSMGDRQGVIMPLQSGLINQDASSLETLSPPLRPYVIDMFAGCGGSSSGFSSSGFSIRHGVEGDMHAAASWQFNFPEGSMHCELVETFLRDIRARRFPVESTAVMLISPPCQGWSRANPGGKNDTENKEALKYVAMAVDVIKPLYVFYENVPSQLSNTHVYAFRQVERDLLQLGYALKFKVLDAAEYGVASHRRRLILLAARCDLELPQWPEKTHGQEGTPPFVTIDDAIKDLQLRNPKSRPLKGSKKKKNSDFCRLVIGQDRPEPSPYALELRDTPDSDLITHHNTAYRLSDKALESFDDEVTVPAPDKPSITIRTSPSSRWACRNPFEPRRMFSVREEARIMSMPDSFRFFGHRNSEYRQIGNAVPPLLARAVADEIAKVLRRQFPSMFDTQEDQVGPDMFGESSAGFAGYEGVIAAEDSEDSASLSENISDSGQSDVEEEAPPETTAGRGSSQAGKRRLSTSEDELGDEGEEGSRKRQRFSEGDGVGTSLP